MTDDPEKVNAAADETASAATGSQPAEPNRVSVSQLRLDPNNPRLPENVQGSSQPALLSYLEENDALGELAGSFLANGFFLNEPLVVLPADGEGIRTVVEGNRRLATLKILLQHEDALEAALAFDIDTEANADRLAGLEAVPVFEIAAPESLRAYLGYRHISGIRRWGAEAKARFIAAAVDREAASETPAPFMAVAKLLGSTTHAVRSSYVAIQVLRFARDEHGLDVRTLLSERFGVWLRLLGTANVPAAIGLDKTAKLYDEVQASIAAIDLARLREVVGDLTPTGGKAVLSDSRDVTRYSDVIADERAYATLRRYNDLELAAQVVQGASLKRRIDRLSRSCEILISEARHLEVDQGVVDASRELTSLADSLGAVLERALSRSERSSR